MSDQVSGIDVREHSSGQAANLSDLLTQLDLPGRRNDLAQQGQVPKELANVLQQCLDLKPIDWLPPSPLSLEQMNKAPIQAHNAEAPAVPKPAQIDVGAGKRIIEQLQPGDKKQLDALRLELAVSTGASEKGDKSAEINAFLKSKLADVPPQGLSAILTPPSLSDLLKEIKTARPGEQAELVQQVRAVLLTNAEHSINNNAKLKDFDHKLAEFDKRAAARNLPESEVLATYLQINRVLDPAMKLEHGDKANLARSMMANVADPTTIDQGGHNTCNVTTLECRLFTQEPAAATKVIADIACGGHFVAADGTVVRPINLDPDNEAKHDPTPDGLRNYASQIFQLAAINSYWNRRDTMPGGKTIGVGKIQYAQGADGEYLLDTSVDPPQKQHFNTVDSGHPWLDIYGVSEISRQLTGHAPKDFGIKRWVYPSDSDGVTKVVTLGGFKDRLVELKNAKAFPVVIEVDAAKKPFGDGHGFGPHVVTITDYDPATTLVTVDNQWGKDADLTDLPGQGKKPTAELLFSSMSYMPSTDFIWQNIKDGMKDVKIKDSIPPTVAALSTKGLRWGISAAAPLAVRGGLGYLSELGVPGAAGALSASETGLGSVALRAGTGLAAFGAFAYANDLSGAFKEGNSHGVGKLTRVVGDWASFELGGQLVNKGLSAVGVWAPIRIPIALAAGMATSTVFDRMVGEQSEIGGSLTYDTVREYLHPRQNIANPEKAIRQQAEVVKPSPSSSALSNESMTAQFVKQYKTYDNLYSGKSW